MDAAGLLDAPRQIRFDFRNEKAPLTADWALRIEAVSAIEMETLMGMQAQFDIAEARKQLQDVRSALAFVARVPMPASAQTEDAPMRTNV